MFTFLLHIRCYFTQQELLSIDWLIHMERLGTLCYSWLVLTHCGHVETIWRHISLNIGSGNGLLPDGTKPLPEPMLTNHQFSLVACTLGLFQGNTQDMYPWCEFQNNSFWDITATSPRGQRVKDTSGLGSHGAWLLEKHRSYLLFSKVINHMSSSTVVMMNL